MPDPAYEEAERLLREAQAKAEEAARAASGAVPPRGWSAPESGGSPFVDLAALTALLDTIKGTVPPELARQLADAVRALLLALRAVLDFYIERLEPERNPPAPVEDIPVE
jgi:uncharacterized protein (UPF0261 family)